MATAAAAAAYDHAEAGDTFALSAMRIHFRAHDAHTSMGADGVERKKKPAAENALRMSVRMMPRRKGWLYTRNVRRGRNARGGRLN